MTRDEMRREVQKLGDAAVARARSLGATQASFTLADTKPDGTPDDEPVWVFSVRKAPGPMYECSWVEGPGLLAHLTPSLEMCFAGQPFSDGKLALPWRPPAE
jgi:hypothetical protein